MSTPRFLIVLMVIAGLVLMLGLSCAAEPTEAPTPPPTATPAPEPPILSSPANETTVTDLEVMLEWDASVDADSYRLQVSTEPSFSSPVINEAGVTGTHYEVTSGLDWKSDYYWRVNASNQGGTSAWSGQWQFSTPIFQLDKIAFTSLRDGNAEVYVMNADGSNQTRLTTTAPHAGNARASWSPDGTKIAFMSERDDNWEIYVMHADGSNQTRLTNNPTEDSQPSWR